MGGWMEGVVLVARRAPWCHPAGNLFWNKEGEILLRCHCSVKPHTAGKTLLTSRILWKKKKKKIATQCICQQSLSAHWLCTWATLANFLLWCSTRAREWTPYSRQLASVLSCWAKHIRKSMKCSSYRDCQTWVSAICVTIAEETSCKKLKLGCKGSIFSQKSTKVKKHTFYFTKH